MSKSNIPGVVIYQGGKDAGGEYVLVSNAHIMFGRDKSKNLFLERKSFLVCASQNFQTFRRHLVIFSSGQQSKRLSIQS